MKEVLRRYREVEGSAPFVHLPKSHSRALQPCPSWGSVLGLELALADRALELRTGDAAAAVLSGAARHFVGPSKQLPALLVNLRKEILQKSRIPLEGKQRSSSETLGWAGPRALELPGLAWPASGFTCSGEVEGFQGRRRQEERTPKRVCAQTGHSRKKTASLQFRCSELRTG